jgi:hypothetical protein
MTMPPGGGQAELMPNPARRIVDLLIGRLITDPRFSAHVVARVCDSRLATSLSKSSGSTCRCRNDSD